MIITKPTKIERACEGLEEVSYCFAYGSEDCVTHGKCNYRQSQILDYLRELWEDATRMEVMI